MSLVSTIVYLLMYVGGTEYDLYACVKKDPQGNQITNCQYIGRVNEEELCQPPISSTSSSKL